MKLKFLLILTFCAGLLVFDVNAEGNTLLTPSNIIGTSLLTNAGILLGLSAYWDHYSKTATVSQSTLYYTGSKMVLGCAIASAVAAVPFFVIPIIHKTHNNCRVSISPESINLTLSF